METDQAPTGAEKYLASLMQDPQYADAWLRERIRLALTQFSGLTLGGNALDAVVDEVMAVGLDHQELIEDIIGHMHLHAGGMDFVRRKMTTEERRAWDAYLAGWKYRMDPAVHEDGGTTREDEAMNETEWRECGPEDGVIRHRGPADPKEPTAPEWRDCADPVELAAAVAAGVEVWCVVADGREWETGCEDSESFRRCMANGCRYRVPASWSWSYEPPTTVTGDDLPERRVWTCKIGGRVGRLSGGADAPMRRAVADAFTAETGCPVEFCFSGWGDDLDESELAVVEDRAPDPEVIRAALVRRLAALPDPSPGVTSMACDHPNPCTSEPPVPPWPDGVLRDAANRLRWIANSGYIEDPGIKRIIRSWADELDATLVPPWPGAVLSGLTDEDGVPTWLAQAGQVRGEQVRIWHGEPWGKPHGSWADSRWVEVRAPRAVPAPETERVPWWEAKDRLGLAGDRFVEVGADDEGPWVRVVEGGTKLHSPVEPDGTVKVLKDGDR